MCGLVCRPPFDAAFTICHTRFLVSPSPPFARKRNDDVFPPVTATLKIPSPTFGKKVSTPDEIAVFKGHGGQYSMRYDWLLE